MQVTTIIPTAGVRPEIRRAVQSVRDSSREPIRLIVVVNGLRPDPAICEWLAGQPDILLKIIPRPSLPGALLHGRTFVTTPFFSTLDDDDEYLPGATDLKLEALLSAEDASLVVTNGHVCTGERRTLLYSNLHCVETGPIKALLQENWLHNCNALYRSSKVGKEYFEDHHAYAEWTWLAYRLAIHGHRIRAISAPTFVYHDTARSLSKSDAYLEACLPLFRRMLRDSPSTDISRLIRRKMSALHHHLSVRALERGDLKSALLNHLRSLTLPGGLGYASYSRHLLCPKAMPGRDRSSPRSDGQR